MISDYIFQGIATFGLSQHLSERGQLRRHFAHQLHLDFASKLSGSP
jgi:hypothetical protein